MKNFKYFSISNFLIIFILSGCVSTPQSVQISQTNIQSDKIYGYYCANNKQIRKLSVTIEYITPKLPNSAVDETAKEQAYFAKRKYELFKKTLFSLSNGEERPNGRGADYLKVRQSNLNHKDLAEKASQYVIKENSYSSIYPKALLMKPTDTDKFILFYGLERDQRFPDQDYNDPTYISELKNLVDNFTILEPLDYQNEAYKCDEDCLKDPNQDHDKVELIAVTEDGKQSISEAAKKKDDIWIRYIGRFTKINEAKTNNPRIINADLELDLNGFCRYGRLLTDLQSQ